MSRAYVGCSDGSCVFVHPGGMHTNGGCKCLRDLPFKRQREIQIRFRELRHKTNQLEELKQEPCYCNDQNDQCPRCRAVETTT